MTSMFPSLYRGGDENDQNRKVVRWQPGDPTPTSVKVGAILFLVTGLLMVFSGILSLTASWDREPMNAEEAEMMRFVQKNTRILGGIQVVLGLVIAFLHRGVLHGYRSKRRWILWVSALAAFFMLAGWVAQFVFIGTALLALMLAIAALLVFRPNADPFFDAGHRLEQDPDVRA